VGLGRLLLGELIALASARGVAALTGEALSDNTRMIELVRQLGFTVRPDPWTRAQRCRNFSSNAPATRSGTLVITGNALDLLA
jgi:GNAT superfamily N-acetyltransferase